MGFGGIASSLIMFIAVMSLTTGVVIGLKQHFDSTSSAINMEQKRVSKELKTDVTIEVTNYKSGQNKLDVYVKNTGNTRLNVNKTDIFLNNIRIPRANVNRSIQVTSDSDNINSGDWDNSEVILITLNTTLASSETHTISVATEFGVKDTLEFSV